MLRRYAFTLALLLLVASWAGAEEFPGRVVGVKDGDTIKIKVLVDEQEVKVRLWGIDAPESGGKGE